MYRCLGAFLTLVSLSFVTASVAEAKPAPAVKQRPALVRPVIKQVDKKAETSAKADTIKTMVREQSAVVVDESSFTAPEGALYTTSDECG